MVTREFPPESGGIGYYVYNLSKKLIKRGHNVTVITRGNMHKTEKKMIDGISLINATFFPVYPFHLTLHGFFVNSIINSLKSQIDVIHLHSPLVPALSTTLPVITTIHTAMKVDSRYHEVVDPYSLAEKLQSTYFSPNVESKLIAISKVVTTVSPSVALELSEYGIDTSKVEVTWNGVDEKLFFPSGNGHSGEYVLYTGVLRARKGLFDLLKCAKIVKQRRPESKFVICGTGPLLSNLKELVNTMGIQENVIFTGRVERKKLIQLYQGASVHVLPSVYEGLPTVLLEAMSCGLPVVATNIGGTRDVISSNENGLLVPPRSPDDLATKILMLLDDEALRKRLGHNARETVLRNFTWDLVADHFSNLYSKIYDG